MGTTADDAPARRPRWWAAGFTSEGGTRIPIALLLLPGFLVGVTFGLGKVVRDCSLTCNVGFRFAPLGILAVALTVVPVSALRARLETRLGFRRWQSLSAIVVAGSFAALWAVTWALLDARDRAGGGPAGEALRWVYLGYFVWLGVAGAVIGPNVKSTIYSAVLPHRRTRLLALSAAAFVAGGLVGSAAAGVGTELVAGATGWSYERVRDVLLLAMATSMIAWIPVIRAIERGRDAVGARHDPAPRGDAVRSGRLGAAVAIVVGDANLRGMAAVIGLGGAAESLVTYLFYWVVTMETSGENGRAGMFSDFYVFLNGATLAMMLFGTQRVLDRWGLRLALALSPIALLFGTVAMAVQLGLVTVYALRVAEKSLEDTLYEPAVDRLLLEIDDEDVAARVRPVLQSVGLMTGRALGALVILALTFGLDVGVGTFLAVFAAILATWLVAVLRRRESDPLPTAPAEGAGIRDDTGM